MRYLYLSVHYRKKLNFTFESLTDAEGALRRIDEMWFRLGHAGRSRRGPNPPGRAGPPSRQGVQGRSGRRPQHLGGARGAVLSLSTGQRGRSRRGSWRAAIKERVREVLGRVDRVLGVLDPEEWERGDADGALSDQEIENLVVERTRAREERDFARADRNP